MYWVERKLILKSSWTNEIPFQRKKDIMRLTTFFYISKEQLWNLLIKRLQPGCWVCCFSHYYIEQIPNIKATSWCMDFFGSLLQETVYHTEEGRMTGLALSCCHRNMKLFVLVSVIQQTKRILPGASNKTLRNFLLPGRPLIYSTQSSKTMWNISSSNN